MAKIIQLAGAGINVVFCLALPNKKKPELSFRLRDDKRIS
jgi:hypothetical protein